MNHKHLIFPVLLLLLTGVLLGGCGLRSRTEDGADIAPALTPTPAPSATPEPTGAPTPEGDAEVLALMQGLSLRQKVGQLFIVRPDSLDPGQTPAQTGDGNSPGVTEMTEEIAERLAQYPVGGVIMFSKNIRSAEQLAAFFNDFRAASGVEPFLSVDEEGGPVTRIAGSKAFSVPKYKNAAAVGSSGNSDDALNMGSTIGGYLREYGFNMDFAPVADVNTNPKNPVIGERAFSSDPYIAGAMAAAMAEGLKQQGIIPVYKHFPGHGDTAEDSHKGIAVSYKTWEEMKSCEWIPYDALTERDCVMVGHIAVPNITGNMVPASLSAPVVTGLLRSRLGFDGVVITDALGMGAVANDYSSGEAALLALGAGCDVLLVPLDFVEAFDAVAAAVENGTIPLQRLDESVYRILLLKKNSGLF